MATVNIHYYCGCGFRTMKVEEAIEHADKHKHIMNVSGSIVSSERKAHSSMSSSYVPPSPRLRTVKPAIVAAPVEVQQEQSTDFSNLRDKLKRH